MKYRLCLTKSYIRALFLQTATTMTTTHTHGVSNDGQLDSKVKEFKDCQHRTADVQTDDAAEVSQQSRPLKHTTNRVWIVKTVYRPADIVRIIQCGKIEIPDTEGL